MWQLLRRGTKHKTAQELMELIETLGVDLEMGARADCSVVSAAFPTPFLGDFLALLTEMLCEPALNEEEFERLRKRTMARLVNDLDDPATLISRAWARGFWGTHPYGFNPSGSCKDLANICRQDVEEYYRRQVGPKISRLYIAGDVSTKEVLALCEKTLGTWVQGPETPQQMPPFEWRPQGDGVLLAHKPEQTQVQFRLGAKGIPKGHPAVFPLAVVGTLLGGMFTSRLVNAVRVKRGLSYHAGCYWDQKAVAGAFVASSFTKPETAEALAEVVLSEIETLQKKGPTPSELAAVKQYLCGCFPMAIQTNDAFLASLADIELHGLPENWIGQYRDNVLAVDMKQARAAARDYLATDNRLLVFSGDADALAPRLARFGPIRRMELSEIS